ncbi:MAG TPA: hypothetical protein VK540_10440 [Polyangiaceae bacterium]|nr:hypothetical protein [Polyangiaceae bacterium]
MLSLALGGVFAACRTESAARAARHWVHCTCSYISDFDEPGAAPIDVCSDGHGIEEVAAACARNDGVGVPTGCQCDGTPRGACEKSDRCRPGKEAPPQGGSQK